MNIVTNPVPVAPGSIRITSGPNREDMHLPTQAIFSVQNGSKKYNLAVLIEKDYLSSPQNTDILLLRGTIDHPEADAVKAQILYDMDSHTGAILI